MILNAVERFSEELALSIHSHAKNSSSVAVLKFALINMINLLIVMVMVLIICIITGDLVSGLIAFFAFPILRYFSGGLHFKSAYVCNVVSALMILSAVYIPVSFRSVGIWMSAASIILLLIYAPSGVKRSRLDPKYYPVLKVIAVLIVGTSLILQSALLAKIFFLQSLTLIRALQRALD